MADILKCSACNIVVDELLCYLQNKISVCDELSLVRICSSAFTSDVIKKSKTLLFESVPTDKKQKLRKNKGKEERDLGDMINLFKSIEPDLIPIFVARDLEKVPPISMDHIDSSKLLKDVLTLKTELDHIKTVYATQESVNNLRKEVLRVQNDSLLPCTRSPPASAFKINDKRGAWIDSGPMGLSNDVHCNESFEKNNVSDIITDTSQLQYRAMKVVSEQAKDSNWRRLEERAETGPGEGDGEALPSRSPADAVTPAPRAPPTSPCMLTNESRMSAETGLGPVSTTSRSPSRRVKQLTDTANNREFLPESKNTNEWQTVPYGKKNSNKYRYAGKSGIARDMECSFRAAERKIPMFITNVHLSTAESDIVKRIYSKTQETVSLERISMKYERDHKAYKFLISEANLSKYMDETLWPVGVIFRRFVSYKPRQVSSVRKENGMNKQHNG
jgi:hypothetical protein